MHEIDKNVNERIYKLLNEGKNEISKKIVIGEKELIKEYLKAYESIDKALADFYKKYGDDISIGTAKQRNRLLNLEKSIEMELQRFNPSIISRIKRGIKDAYRESFNVAGFAHTSVVSLNFSQLDPNQITASIYNPMDRIKWTGRLEGHFKTTFSKIKSEISQGLIRGQGYVKTAHKVKEKMEGLLNNTLRIVRTETHRAQQAGLRVGLDEVVKAGKAKGIDVELKWISTKDLRTRDSHRGMDNQPADEDGMFTFVSGVNAGAKTSMPGGSGLAEEDIHCRCDMRTELKGFEPKEMRDNISKEFVPFSKYGQWIKSR
jgi:Phage Mu protein F like protein